MINSHDDSFYGQPLNTQSYEQRIKTLTVVIEDQKEMFDACYKDREYYRKKCALLEAEDEAFKEQYQAFAADSERYKHLISNNRRYRIQLPYVGLQTKADYDEAIDREIALDKAYNPADTGTLQH